MDYQEMAYGKSNGNVTDDVSDPTAVAPGHWRPGGG